MLQGFRRQFWTDNSIKTCVKMCSKAGFAFAGLEFGVECYCGHNHPDPSRQYVELTNHDTLNHIVITYLFQGIFQQEKSFHLVVIGFYLVSRENYG